MMMSQFGSQRIGVLVTGGGRWRFSVCVSSNSQVKSNAKVMGQEGGALGGEDMVRVGPL